MTTRRRSLVTAWLLFTCLLGPRAAQALHFTTPPPALDAALAEARQGDKVLLLVFSASWCGPCKRLARDLKKPAAAATLQRTHVVIYDGEAEPGSPLMRRYQVSSYPSLVALDRGGEVVERKSGYDNWAVFSGWLQKLHDNAQPLPRALEAARENPKDGARQLAVALRLLGDGTGDAKQTAEARGFLQRAVDAGPPKVAAQAAWRLAQLEHEAQRRRNALQLAHGLATRHAGTSEGDRALRVLAAQSEPPTAQLELLLAQRVAAERRPSKLSHLAYTALKARAYGAARQAAARLEALAPQQAEALDTRAEVAFLADGQSARAIALEEQALAAAEPQERARLEESLARFRRGQKEPPPALARVDARALLPRQPDNFEMPRWFLRQRQLSKRLEATCADAAPAQTPSLRLVVLTGSQPGQHRVVLPAGVAAPLAACITKGVQATDLPHPRTLQMNLDLTPAQQGEVLEDTAAVAEDECGAHAGKLQALHVVLVGAAGQPPRLSFQETGAEAEPLRRCVSGVYGKLRLKAALLETQTLSFNSKAEDEDEDG